MNSNNSVTTSVLDIDLFYLILECYGWETPDAYRLEECKTLFNHPEAILSYSTRQSILEFAFHEPLNMFSLRIWDIYKQQSVLFHFMYHHQPQRLLEWLAAVSDLLTLESYPQLLKQAAGKCEMILLEVDNQQMYEVIPPKTRNNEQQ